jgi:hypothetical protein
MSLLPIL